MPNAISMADVNVAPSKEYAVEPKATPTAKPSGILCNVMENISIRHLLKLFLSFSSFLFLFIFLSK